jgi:hypothetical protein
MSTLSNKIDYVVTYDSAYTLVSGMPSGTPTVLAPMTNIQFQRNIAPSEDNAIITLAGIQRIQSAREVYIYRVNSDGTYTLKFRGMTTNPKYSVSDDGLITTVQIASLWYMLQIRLFQIAGKSPPPLQPNTNPYLVYLNPTLALRFGVIWADILVNAFQESYSTGHLPSLHLANLSDDGTGNMNIGIIPPYLTDFDNIVVNDNMNIQYQSISAVVDRLVTSALFNSEGSSPFLAEYRLDIGDFPYTAPVDTVIPKLPTLTVMLFDPVHSKLGNGNNRTGILLGDNSLDPAGTLPANLVYPMDYVEFGVTNGYEPIDTIVFSEGDNIVSIELTYDYLVMNNSYVLSGGSFQGSDVVALPIDNQRSIAEYGLKQTNQSLSNVVDQGEIKRFVGTSINFFQHPIPNIVLKPDYTYASSHILYAGDYILINAPSLIGVLEDSNGNPLEGSYSSESGDLITAAFTARVKTIDITWNPTDGEDITLTLTFPVQNVPIAEWNAVNNTQQQGSLAGAMQFMYTTVAPSAKTIIGRSRQSEGAALYQSGSDFVSNRSHPLSTIVSDTGTEFSVTPDSGIFELPIFAQHIANNMDAVVAPYTVINGNSNLGTNILYVASTALFVAGCSIIIGQGTVRSETNNVTSVDPIASTLTLQTNLTYTHTAIEGDSVTGIETLKGDDILIYQFGVEVDTPNTAPSNTASAPSVVYLTVLQPDGMAIIDTVVDINQLSNILSLLSKSHRSPLSSASSAPFLTDIKGNVNLSGRYQVIVRNAKAYIWCPNPLFQTPQLLAPPIATPNTVGAVGYSYIITPCTDVGGNDPFGMSYWTWITSATIGVAGHNVALTWQAVSGAASYNIYRQDSITTPFDILNYGLVGNSLTTSFTDSTVTPTVGFQPYPPFVTQLVPLALGANLVTGHTYWYVVTAINPAGNETVISAAGSRDHLGVQDTEPVAPVQLYVEWPSIPKAQSYNVYRGDNTFSLANLYQIASGIIVTNFTDDGTVAPDTSITPPSETSTETFAAINPYIVYVNYSYLQDPAHTQIVSSNGTNNPSTAIVYDPTQRRVYQTNPFVAP